MNTRNILSFICILALSVTLLSCSSSTSHTVNGVNLQGNWILSNVSLEGVDTRTTTTTQSFNDAGNSKVTVENRVTINSLLFDDAKPDCFKGSVWHLPFNGVGNYTIQGNGDCPAGTRNIRWSVRTDANGQKLFQLKVLDGNVKAKNVTDGYILNIVNTTASGFTLKSPVNVDGKTAYVVYDFSRQ